MAALRDALQNKKPLSRANALDLGQDLVFLFRKVIRMTHIAQWVSTREVVELEIMPDITQKGVLYWIQKRVPDFDPPLEIRRRNIGTELKPRYLWFREDIEELQKRRDNLANL